MAQLVILADDLTGAADAGGAFARVGLPASLVLDGEPGAEIAVVIRTTGSRGMGAVEAAAVNRRAASAIPSRAPEEKAPLVYKKIDSLLRGHPYEELRAVLEGLGETRALVAPALPVEGRTTVGGRQLAGGAPLDGAVGGRATDGVDLLATFGCDRGPRVAHLDLATIRRGPGHIARMIGGVDTGMLIADAETDDDLALVARGALDSGIRVLAGSAGLARQLAVALAGDGTSFPRATVRRRATRAVLTVAASRHPATAAQVEALAAAGVAVVRPSQANLDDENRDLDAVTRALAGHLAEDRPVVLTTTGLAPSRRGSAHVVRLLGELAADLAQRGLVGGLVLTGGDVAAGVAAALGTREIVLGGEVRPAIPWGMLHSALLPEAPVVTKAGSFGERRVLLACLEFLREHAPA